MTNPCQRWLFRRDRYRPAGEVIDTRAFDVAPIAGDTEPKAFVEAHHYSGSYPAARARFGLYRAAQLVGVAVFSHPANAKVLTSVFPGDPMDSAELGRFVLLDDVPGNGETWFLARCFEHLRRDGLRGVVSFSDPHPRTAVDGRIVFPGHIGTIYQAHNGRYTGRGTARTLHLLPDGAVLNGRTLQKIRSGERGWRYSAAVLQRFGAGEAPAADGDRRDWLRLWLPRLTRTATHPGNHRYAWPLQSRVSVALPTLPYPKPDVTLIGQTN